MSSDSEFVDNPEVPEVLGVKRKVLPKRKSLKISEINDCLRDLSSSEGEDFDEYDSDKDPEYVLKDLPEDLDVSIQSSGVISDIVDLESENVAGPSTPRPRSRPSVFVTPPGRQPPPREGSSGGSGKRRPLSTPKVGRKRKLNQDNWLQTIARNKRQKGEEYVSVKTHKTVAARVPGPICKDRCLLTVPEESRKEIFDTCWAIGSYDARLNYYNSCVSERQFKRKYTAKEVSLRPAKIVFTVKCQQKQYEICRSAFQSIHGMTSKEMQVFLSKRKQSPTGALPTDSRGRHEPGSKIKGVQLERVHEHIRMLCVTSSHYSRIKNPARQYTVDEGLTVQKLFLLM